MILKVQTVSNLLMLRNVRLLVYDACEWLKFR